MRTSVLISVLVALVGTAALAQNVAVIKERQDHLEAMGKAVKAPIKMYKGEEDFELEKVISALKVIQEKTAVLPKLFPEDSKTGEDTEALPAIWKNKADFTDRFSKLGAAAKTAEAAITDEFTFQDEILKVLDNCKNCHKKYRKAKK